MSQPTTRGALPTSLRAPAPPADAAAETTRRRILVVDDNEANRYAVSYWLREAGYDVVEADTGERALALATHEPAPSLILLDIRLPDTTGFDVLHQLRADPRTAHTPVVHVTASFTTSEWRAHGLEAGADGYLTHPIEPRELVATVRALLRVRVAEERVRTAAVEWTATLDALDEPVLLVDVRERVARGNRAAATLLRRVCVSASPAAPELATIEGVALADVAVGPLAPMLAVARRVLADAHAEAPTADEDAAVGDEIHIADRRYALVARPVRDDGTVRGVVCVLSDVTERALLLDEAEEARRIAETANRAKSTFLATMSHEIRTPINAILGYADLLDLGVAGTLTPQQRDYLARVQDSSRHLLTLVDDVLDLAKVDAGQLRVRHEIGTLADVVDGARALVAPSAEAKGLALRVEGVTRELVYRGDEHRVRQVLLNLLTNAVKFTPRGGEVVVAAGATAAPPAGLRGVPLARYGGWTWLTVRDTGIGIPADRHEAVFDPFVQVEDGLTRTRGGTGLGLTISRQLARLMDGELLLDSVPGEGSTFTLWLPATEPALRAERAERDAATGARETPAHGSGFAPGLSAHGAAIAGTAIIDGMRATLHLLERRLREDPQLQPVAGRLAPLVLLGHHQALLASIASALVGVADEHEAGSFRDGVRIRHTIAELHGAQRHRLGWEPAQLLREFAIVREELEQLIEACLVNEPVERAPVLDMVRRLVEQASGVAMHAVPARAGHGS